jgi:uroporphyrinogen-III synthase
MALRDHVDDSKLLVAIGENTASAMRGDGHDPLVPREYTLDGILRVLRGWEGLKGARRR